MLLVISRKKIIFRLSFCLSPQRQQQLDSMMASGTASTIEVAVSQQKTSVVIENDLEASEDVIISPTKKLLSSTESTAGCAISR